VQPVEWESCIAIPLAFSLWPLRNLLFSLQTKTKTKQNKKKNSSEWADCTLFPFLHLLHRKKEKHNKTKQPKL